MNFFVKKILIFDAIFYYPKSWKVKKKNYVFMYNYVCTILFFILNQRFVNGEGRAKWYVIPWLWLSDDKVFYTSWDFNHMRQRSTTIWSLKVWLNITLKNNTIKCKKLANNVLWLAYHLLLHYTLNYMYLCTSHTFYMHMIIMYFHIHL